MKKISRLRTLLLLGLSLLFMPMMAQVEINPINLDLGEWPIGGWQESRILELSNSSPDTLSLISSELIDPENAFSFDNFALPWQLLPITDNISVEIGLTDDNITEGVYNATYQVTCEGNPTPSTAQIMVSAYDPVIGDIIENPIIATPPFTHNNTSTAYPFRANYHITDSSPPARDVVYKIELAQDEILQIDVSGTSIPAILALYEESFQGESGPMDHNALAITNGSYLDIPVTAGSYYLIVRSSIAWQNINYDLSIYTNQWPLPNLAFNPSPADGATDVPNLDVVLDFELSDLVLGYQVLLATSYPPTLEWIPWTMVNSDNSVYIPQLDGNTTYYWQVNVMNNTGNQIGDIWSFETINSPPTNLTATIEMVGGDENDYNVILSWTLDGVGLLGFNVYRDGTMINISLVTQTTYTDFNVPYNMDPCYVYQVEAIFDQGLSSSIVDSNPVCINGTGIVEGYVSDALTGDPIEGAVVEAGYYTVTTDLLGYYNIEVLSNTYALTASSDAYTTETRENVPIEYDQTTTEDFQLGPYPYPVDTVMASIINDTTAFIEWTLNDSNPDNPILGYNIYRDTCQSNESPIFIASTIEESYLDEDWNSLNSGVYQYLIEVIYATDSSELVASNCLDKDMFASTYIGLTTCTGDAPGGAIVILENISDPNLIYSVEMDNTGMATIDSVYIGYYQISVILYGYYFSNPEYYDNFLIIDQTSAVLMICEVYTPPTNLYVTPTGMATWEMGNQSLFENYSEDFSEGFPSSWTVENGGNSDDTWTITTDANYSGGNYMKCDSYDAGQGIILDEKLFSPIFNTQNTEITSLEWNQNYQNASGQDVFKVEVFNGYEWIEIHSQMEDDPAWPEMVHKSINVSEYKNQNFQFRFIYQAPEWSWNISIDNVKLIADEGKSVANTKAFQLYKVFLDGAFYEDTDDTFFQYGENDELTPGETYIAGIKTLYTTGPSDAAQYQWTYIPSGGFIGPPTLNAEVIDGSNDVLIQWGNLNPLELIEVNQNYGSPQSTYYQEFGHGYGVVYDLSAYPDAMINAMDFRHSSWGNTGIWDYNIHVIDWDTKTTLAELGPFQTTGDDKWENLVDLGEVLSNGANEIAILLEPLGHTENNAYPRIDLDNANDAQGSIYGDLEDLENMSSSNQGNFLMDLWIQTTNAGKQMLGAKEIPNYEAIGTNVYRNDSLIAYVPHPDTFYIDQNVSFGELSYCVATVYTADGGVHTWTSLVDEVCVEDIILPPNCDPPMNLWATQIMVPGNTEYYDFEWDAPNFFPAVWLQYDDGVNVDGIGGPSEFSYAVKWDPDQLEGFDGAVLSKVNFFPREEGTTFTLKVWKGENASTLLYEQSLNNLDFDTWNEIELTNTIPIDPSETLWLGFYVVTPGYPAGCGNFTGSPNSDLITLDGVNWERLADYGMDYCWNLAAYCMDANGKSIALPELSKQEKYSEKEIIPQLGHLNPVSNLRKLNKKSNELLGYHFYRDGEQINTELITNTFYSDTLVDHYPWIGVCWFVTAIYEECESDPSNEICTDVMPAISKIDNSLKIYPNPAQDHVMIEANTKIASIKLRNYLGQIKMEYHIINSNHFRLDTKALKTGVYILEIASEKGLEKVKIIIQK